MINTHQPLTGTVKSDSGHSLLKRVLALVPATGECLWFCLSFLLFLLLGPFSAIAVVIGLFSLASEENRNRMLEPEKV